MTDGFDVDLFSLLAFLIFDLAVLGLVGTFLDPISLYGYVEGVDIALFDRGVEVPSHLADLGDDVLVHLVGELELGILVNVVFID